MTDLETAERGLAEAQAKRERAEQAQAAVVGRLGRAKGELEDLDAEVLALPANDVKALVKLDGQRTAVRLGIEVLERATLPQAEAIVAEATAAVEVAIKECDRAQRDELHARFDAEEEEIARVAQEAEGRLRELLLQHQATGGTIVDLTHQQPRGRFLAAAGHAGHGGDRGKMWLALVAPLNDLDAVSREAAHLRWIDDVRRSRGQPTAREAEDARVRQFVDDLAERERAAAERRARRERGEIPPEPPPPPPPPPPRAETSWADRSRKEE